MIHQQPENVKEKVRQRPPVAPVDADGAANSAAGSRTWRVFIALPLDEHCIAHLTRLQDELRAALARHIPDDTLAWTRPQNFHLTLRFVGDIAPECSENLRAAMVRACSGVVPFRLDLQGLGCFPHARSPRVVWAGIGGDLEALQTLQSRIESATAGWGQPLERRAFHPHLTLARVRAANRQRPGRQTLDSQTTQRIGAALEALSQDAPLDIAWTAREVVLMRSEPAAGGSRYSVLASSTLSGS